MVSDRLNVLFLCTGNSARSIMAEVLLRHWGGNRFRSFSAGSKPRGEVNPLTLAVLERAHLPTEDLRSKSWSELTAPGMPELHFVITVCGNAAEETCPTWPGQPVTAHWGVDDPAAAKGSDAERLRAFERALRELEARIKLFVALPLESLDRLALQARLGQIAGASASTTTT